TRTVKQTTTYDTTYGMPITVEDSGDTAKSGDEICTRTTYVRNTAAWLIGSPSRVETYASACAENPTLPDDTISDVTTAYDGQAVGVPPTKGDATASYRVADYDANRQPIYKVVSTSSYDALGRLITATDALNRTSTTSYVSAGTGYGPVVRLTSTDPKQYTSTTDVDPAWGTALKFVDPNGNVTEQAVDALGRLISVWKPDRARALNDAPSLVYTYSVNNDKETWIRTDTLKADGKTYNTMYEILDSLLRPRQKQVPSPTGGRVISETLYDDRGQAYIKNDQVHDNLAPEGRLANTFPGSVPASTETVFDGAGRATDSIFRVYDQERWRTSTRYEGDRTSVTAAPGGSGTLTVTDARGRTIERREYAGPTPAGADYSTTRYTYTPGGQVESITGPDGAVNRSGSDGGSIP
ncbi:hypothetical protein ACFUYG_31225, partial [Streptomyces sp. NPDC057386]